MFVYSRYQDELNEFHIEMSAHVLVDPLTPLIQKTFETKKIAINKQNINNIKTITKHKQI